jgi:hypothetical protein
LFVILARDMNGLTATHAIRAWYQSPSAERLPLVEAVVGIRLTFRPRGSGRARASSPEALDLARIERAAMPVTLRS